MTKKRTTKKTGGSNSKKMATKAQRATRAQSRPRKQFKNKEESVNE